MIWQESQTLKLVRLRYGCIHPRRCQEQQHAQDAVCDVCTLTADQAEVLQFAQVCQKLHLTCRGLVLHMLPCYTQLWRCDFLQELKG